MFNRLLSRDLPRNRWLALLLIAIVLGLALTPFMFPGTKALNVAAKIIVFIVLVASFDLLLTDIALGAGMRGTELAAQALLRIPVLAVLLMSGFSAELLEADRIAPPTWDLLRKPYSRDELARAIARVVTR